ncbi:MAG: hypothetical protein QM564_07510 [Bergeyella sp.]
MSDLSNLLPYAVAILIAIPFLVLFRQFVYTYISLKERELRTLGIKEGNDLRFQAFERMTLFLERIKPSNLVSRFDKSLEPHEFLFLTEKNIQEELEYNNSQQIYISSVNWTNIISTKEKLIKILHSTYEGLGANADLEDFKSVFLLNYINEGDFISETIDELKKELLILNYNA